LWLRPIALELSGEPPRSLELQGATFERTKSVPVMIDGDESTQAMFAEYADARGQRAVVLTSPGRTLAGVGESVLLSALDRMEGQALDETHAHATSETKSEPRP
jgi:hypothetical protein